MKASDIIRTEIEKLGTQNESVRLSHAIAMQRAIVADKGRHPNRKFEAAISAMLQGLALYAEAHQEAYGSPVGEDGYIGPEWHSIAGSIKDLLNGELGDLDGGTLDGTLRAIATAAGFDGDKL